MRPTGERRGSTNDTSWNDDGYMNMYASERGLSVALPSTVGRCASGPSSDERPGESRASSVTTLSHTPFSRSDDRHMCGCVCCHYGFTLTDDTQLHAHHPTIKHYQTNQHYLCVRQVSAKRSTLGSTSQQWPTDRWMTGCTIGAQAAGLKVLSKSTLKAPRPAPS